MSVHVTAYVWEHSAQSGTDLLLMLAIADMANKEGVAWPSVPTLSRFIRMSERSVQRTLASLEASGELEVQRNRGPNGTHLYRVKMNQSLPLFTPDTLPTGGDVKLSPDKLTGVTGVAGGVTSEAKTGDTAMSPEPSGTNYRTGEKPVDNSQVNPKPPLRSLAVREFHEELAKATKRREAA